LGEWQVPFALVFTKADKVTQRETAAHVKEFLEIMRKDWEFLPPHFVTSAVKHLGAKQLRQYIGQLNENFFQSKKLH
jgi:GTP-binding protein